MRLKSLERLRTGGTTNRMQLAIPLPQTPDGRVYRYSPNADAHPRHFVLGGVTEGIEILETAKARMKLSPRSNQTVCPYSGTVANDQDFVHPDDVKAATEVVKHAALNDVRGEIGRIFDDMARKFSSNRFVKIETKSRSTPTPKPHFARQDLLRELVCDHCGRDYGVYAIALFCPDCGAPNLRLHFLREAMLVSMQVDLAEAQDASQEELAYRLLGNAHEDVLTAFEATLKTVYLHGMAVAGLPIDKPVRNDFQNIDNARRRFAELTLDPFDGLDPVALEALRLNIQKRHIIGHNLGIVDAKFAEHAADAKIGQTVRLVGADIRTFATLAQKVVDRLDSWLAGNVASPFTETTEVIGLAVTPVAPASPFEQAAQQLAISPLAVQVGCWLAEQSVDGLSYRHADNDALVAAFPNVDAKAIAEAVAELSADGYIETTHTMSHSLPYIRPQLDLFATFDPLAKIGNPIQDAAALVTLILAGDDAVDVKHLHQQSGLAMRQFNPAAGLAIAQVDDRRVSKTITDTYPTRHFHLAAEDRVALKRFAAKLSG